VRKLIQADTVCCPVAVPAASTTPPARLSTTAPPPSCELTSNDLFFVRVMISGVAIVTACVTILNPINYMLMFDLSVGSLSSSLVTINNAALSEFQKVISLS